MVNNNKENGIERSRSSVASERRKLIYKSLRNISIIYLLISLLTDKMSIFAALCAGFPFFLPSVAYGSDKDISGRIIQSLILGIPGIIMSVIFMLITGTYSTATWAIPSLLSFGLCLLYSVIQKQLSCKAAATARSVMLVAVFFVCFL